MSWNDQVAAEEGNNMVSRAEYVPKSTQLPQAPMLGPLNMIHGSAESSSHLGNQNITHNNELWDSEHHALSLSGYSGHLETDTKMLSTSLKRLTGFIKQHPLGGRVRHGSHRGGSLQNVLGDERTCGTTLASAYVLRRLSAAWSQLQMKEGSPSGSEC